jgi:hypothetical protein
MMLALLCLGMFVAFPPRMLADDWPKFADPEVTAYVKALALFRDRYVAAAKRGDDRQLKLMDAQFTDFQKQATRLVDKLEPSETKLFTEYVTACGQTILDAAYGFGQPHLRPH